MKLIIGLLGIGVLTWFVLQPLGYARAVAEDLESRTLSAIEAQGAEGIDVSVDRSPVGRTIYLSGEVPDNLKRQMREIALGQRGVSDALWAGEEVAAADNGEAATSTSVGASSAEVASCQSNISALLAEDTIQFRSGSAYLNPASNRLLDRLADATGDCAGVRIAIVGHSDRTGREGVNREMSAERAVRVRDALITRGLPADMFSTEGKGSSEPLGDNPADPANRRIEFTVSAANAPAEGGAS